ncbi:anti-sigma factor [Luteipulveratus flavus]|uniref:Anti-sigma factor n=1 Tax=Luteipulveratus flavus TaxID=3031728 RepID=A0ABT6CCC1_9MICO|nr:anti-sigma factor [Luteipulveratus sp. YIM 133296]MDF8266158.1 anti-sigma factor [Luteipulveratus sp. YIM 133296]
MTHPTDDELVDVALGFGPTDPQVAAHLRTCARCQESVEELRQVRSRISEEGLGTVWLDPPRDLWPDIEQAIDAAPAASASADDSEPAPAGGPGATAADEPAATRAPSARPTFSRRWAAIGLAAVVLVGAVVGWGAWSRSQDNGGTVLASATLGQLQADAQGGTAQLVRSGGAVSLRVDANEPQPGQGYLEVWLINTDGTRMISLGVLRGRGSVEFPVTQAVIDAGYTTVDVSHEQFDDKPAHSGDSLVRGRLQ